MNELESFVCGEFLGSGIARDVYVFVQDNTRVIKIAKDKGGQMHNLVEWTIWDELKDTKQGKWLAPCIDVSDCGKYLIMKRAEKGRHKDYPKLVPKFLTDRKYDNYGWIGDNLVCVDYANILLSFNGKLQKANWWE